MAGWVIAAYGALVIVGVYNREITGLLLVAAWLALQPQRWRWGIVYAGLALVTYYLIQQAVGPHENGYTLQHVWHLNTYSPHLLDKAINYNLMLAPLWLAILASWRRADVRLRRLVVTVAVFYLPPFFALAIWQETRLLMPFVVLAMPMVLSRRTA